MYFNDRRHAGQVLAEAVCALAGIKDGVVLALLRGGVPVAYEVAVACHLPLDVLVVRKLGVPGREELAMGAIAGGGGLVLNQDVLDAYRISETRLRQVIEREQQELERREKLYRQGRLAADIVGRTAILVDDGLATGASMRAAVRAVKGRSRQVIVAVPVGAASTCAELAGDADQVICLLRPEPMEAVSLFYRQFEQTGDEEIRQLLRATERVQRDETPIP